ncbi:hypothetical protein HQ529_04720 [Candidatus Woesearchaeota archaeon]|nr:hypothetical protein [Candidatus Woesearchaeota archaeon]
MNFKEWWKKLEYWKKGFLVGLFFGIIRIFLWGFLSTTKIPILRELFGLEFDFICHSFKLGAGEPCGVLFWIWFAIISPILFIFFGILIFYFKAKYSRKNLK